MDELRSWPVVFLETATLMGNVVDAEFTASSDAGETLETFWIHLIRWGGVQNVTAQHKIIIVISRDITDGIVNSVRVVDFGPFNCSLHHFRVGGGTAC